MSDRGSLCFAALPLPDSQNKGGNEAGGGEGRSERARRWGVVGGGVDLWVLLHQFLSLAPSGMGYTPLCMYTTACLCTHANTLWYLCKQNYCIPPQARGLTGRKPQIYALYLKHLCTCKQGLHIRTPPSVPKVNYDLLCKITASELITGTNASKQWLISLPLARTDRYTQAAQKRSFTVIACLHT